MDDPDYPLTGGYLKSIRDWSEDVPDPHGDIRIYTRERNNEWIEFRIRFTNGVVQEADEIQQPPVGQQTDAS